MAGYSPISDILSFGKSKKYSDKIMSNIINIELTEDKKGIRFTTQDGVSFTVFFPYTLHEHSNLDILERINVDENGKLTFDGKSIEGDIFIKDDYYNKAEIDNRITSIAKGMSWKQNVSTKEELENLENNSKGDARIVDEESNIYVFNGESWDKVGSSINIPNATSENDGLLSKEYFIKINKLDTSNREMTRSKNLYNTIFERGFISSDTGLPIPEVTMTGMRTRDFIDITEQTGNISLQRVDLEGVISITGAYAYDNDKNYIKKLTLSVIKNDGEVWQTAKLTSDMKFIKVAFRISEDKTSMDFETYVNSMNFQVEYGLIPSGYEEYTLKIKKEKYEGLKDIKALSMNDELLDNPLNVIKETAGYTRMFKTIGCIGDSVAKGYVTTSVGGVDLVDYSFPSYLEKICGNKVYNWGVSGATSKSWLEGYNGSTAHIECFDGNHKCDAYIIGLGGNDGKNNDVPVGSLDDIKENYNDNPNTFYGNMDKIIRKIKEIQPKAKIFLTTYLIYDLSRILPYEGATRILATKYENCYLLDLHLYGEKYYDDYDYSDGHHKNALGYLKKAHIIATYIDWVIKNNKSDFMNVQFIGTDYEIKEGV